jgi:hypothetical protein
LHRTEHAVLLRQLEHYLRVVRAETDGLAVRAGPAAVALADLRRHLGEAEELLADLRVLLGAAQD